MRKAHTVNGMTMTALVFMIFMMLGATAANASTIVTLNSWNQQQFNSDGDTVTVTIDSIANTLTLAWNSGNAGIPNAIGIDKFYFNGQLLVDPSYLATSAGWGLGSGSSPHNADGFTLPYINEMDSAGGSSLSGIVFTFPADGGSTTFDTDFTGSSSFAAHVRYGSAVAGGSCSGFVSNQIHPTDTIENSPDCQPTQQTPEPSSLLMLGLGLPLVCFMARKMPKLMR